MKLCGCGKPVRYVIGKDANGNIVEACNKYMRCVLVKDETEGGCMSSLGEEFPKEQERVRTVLGYYKEIGPAGLFGATYIEEALRRADRAAISGDVVAIIQSYEELKKIEA